MARLHSRILLFALSLSSVGCSALLDTGGQQCSRDEDCRRASPSLPLTCDEGVCVMRDASSGDTLPVTIDDHFNPTGRAADAEAGQVTEEACPLRAGMQNGECHAFVYTPTEISQHRAVVSWQSPDDNWGSAYGYDMPAGAKAISFYAWASRTGASAVFGAGFSDGDGFEARSAPITLGTEPRRYWVSLEGASYTDVANGFMWELEATTDEAVTLFVDDIQWIDTPPPVDVTFQVDVTALALEPGCEVFVYGSFNEWTIRANPMSDEDGNGIYTATVSVPQSAEAETEYLFAYACGETESIEMITEGSACIIRGHEGGNNRHIRPTEATVVDPVCFATCGSCQPFYDITLQVDMAEHPVPTGCHVHAPGGFNNWDSASTVSRMVLWDDPESDTDTVYRLTLPMMAGVPYTYKYVIKCEGGADQWEEPPEMAGCTVRGDYVNRAYTANQNATLPAYCFGTCAPCTP